MYKSPIEIIQGQVRMEQENGIMRAVLEQGIKVDKHELLLALQYDRKQYNAGYHDGKADALEERRWIPVTERYPQKGMDHLCRCVVNDCNDMPFYMVLRYILIDEVPHFQHETKGGMKVTHWMPLPNPPKE